MGATQFAIYSQEEFAHLFLSEPLKPQKTTKVTPLEKLKADKIDWDEKGKVSPVKFQGMCGSAVTFATLASIESFAAIVDGSLPGFSEQQLIDCVFGCGGYPSEYGY